MARHTAVVLTGMERSFAEIGANVREGLFGALASASGVEGSSATFFGVRPPNDTWDAIRLLLPIAAENVEVQQR